MTRCQGNVKIGERAIDGGQPPSPKAMARQGGRKTESRILSPPAPVEYPEGWPLRGIQQGRFALLTRGNPVE